MLSTSVVLVLTTSAPASAHAELLSTSPSPSSVLLLPPHQVVLRFDEAVTVGIGSISVLAVDGRRIDQGGASHAGGRSSTVVVGLPRHLADGTYVVGWRVVSDDGHPVHGAFIFSVGSAAGAGRAASEVAALRAAHGSAFVGAVYGIVRFALFAGLLVLVGVSAVVASIAPHAWRARRIRLVVWSAWGVLLVSTVVGVAVQGVYAAALPLSRVASASLFDDVLHTRFGEVQLLRLVLLALVLPLLLGGGPGRWRRRPGRAFEAVALGVGLLLTPGLAGHASTLGNGIVGESLDAVHLAGAALWVGGLVVLAMAAIPPRPAPDDIDVASVARRFSPLALAAVLGIVTTGILQSARRVGSSYALYDTAYGRILMVKIALVALLVAAGAVSRRQVMGTWLPGRRLGRTAGTPRDVEPFGRPLVAEVSLAAAVLVAASLLVNAVPARQAAAQPFTTSFELHGVEVNALVAPATVGGGNLFHFYVLGPLGQPMAVAELEASISLPSAGRPARAVPLVVASPGHYQASGVDLPVAGSWMLTVTVRQAAPGAPAVHLHTVMPVH